MHRHVTHCIKLVMRLTCSYYVSCVFLYYADEKESEKIRMK